MSAPTAELVFVLERPRGRFANVVSSLSELWGGELPPMDTVDAVYDATRNRVLICAHYDARALTEGVRTRIHIIARDAGVPVLAGEALEDIDRCALVDDGEYRVEAQPALAIALWNLARLMGGEEVWAGEPEPPPPLQARSITANEIADRGGVYSMRPTRPVGLVPPPDDALADPRTRTAPGPVPARARPSTRPPSPVPLPPRPSSTAAGTQRGLGDKARVAVGTTSPATASTGSATAHSASAVPAAARTASGSPTGSKSRVAAGTAAPQTTEATESTRHALAKGSSPRTSTLRDVVAPHAIGSRPVAVRSEKSGGATDDAGAGAARSRTPSSPPPSAPPLAAGSVAKRRPTAPTKPPALQIRSAEDGTSPRIELDGHRDARDARDAHRDAHRAAIAAGTAKTTDAEGEPGTAKRPDRITPSRHLAVGAHVPPTELTPPPALIAPGPIERHANAVEGSASSAGIVIARTSTDDVISGPVTVADPVARAGTQGGTDPYMPALQHRGDASSIDVRYLRSGRWAPARLRALSLKGAYLITAAFPRVGDHVHIALGLGDLGALVRGSVFHVTTPADIASTGTSGFAVRFDLDDAAKSQLSVLLHRARARGVTITPPPPRGSVRLPVQWPVKLGTSRGAIKGDALDVSRGGMFVHAVRALDVDQPVSFSAVLDDGTAPVSGRARVVREINETDAARRGLRAGFGLAIQEMGDDDLQRWNLFLGRVQRRSEHRILVGASPGRLTELTSGLAGAGYAVIGGTDAGTLVQLSDAEARPPDVAVIDATLFEGSEPNWLETLFSARKVPCITLRGDSRRARVVVDRLLAV